MSMWNVPLIIGNKPVQSGKTFTRTNPVTGTVVTTAAAATVVHAREAAEAAAAAFPVWSATAPDERRRMLNAAADLLEAREADLTAAMIQEVGATAGWAHTNIASSVAGIREAAALVTQIGGQVMPSNTAGCLAMTLREPVGVILGIAPWNAPVVLGVRAIAVPLACGNTVILKGSEQCPRTHALIVEAFVEAGFGNGIVNLIVNAPEDADEVVSALIDHPAVRRINFTGSTAVGRIIGRRAGELLKPVLLELGGKAPLLILEDADLAETINAATFGAFMNQGQICMSTERIIVVDEIADAFAAGFAKRVSALKAGDPALGEATLGAVVDGRTVSHVRELIADALAKGATQLVGGEAEGTIMPPHVIADVTPDMRLFREESFGPVVALVRARDEDEAVELANDSDYGLAAAIFTGDAGRGLRLAQRIQSGLCHINGPTVQVEAHTPFGGVKASGFGHFGGQAGIEAFTQLRLVTIATQPGRFPF